MDPLRKPAPPLTLVPRNSPPVVQAPLPFWPRVRRAVFLLIGAITLHTWMLRAPQPDTMPAAQVIPKALPTGIVPVGTAGASGATAPETGATAPETSQHVRVERTLVSAPATRGVVETRPEVPVEFRRAAAPKGAPSIRPGSLSGAEPEAEDDAVIVPTASDRSQTPHARENPVPVPSAPLMATLELRDAPGGRIAAPSTYAAVPAPPVREPASVPASGTAAAAMKTGDAGDLERQEQLVLEIVRDYRRAYEQLDVAAAKALYPALDVRALEKAFQGLQAQQLRFAPCGVSIRGQAANARCPFEATYHPKVGSRVVRVTEREWSFDLSRNDLGWQIVNATIQTAH